MRIPDVNVLIAAFRTDHRFHEGCSRWLLKTLNDGEPFGLLHVVVNGFIRITTNPKLFRYATPADEALDQMEFLLRHPAVEWVRPGADYWQCFRALCSRAGTLGDLTTDLHIAAVAVERRAIVATMDRDFSRFAGVNVEAPC